MIQTKLRVRLKYQPESSFRPRVWVELDAARHRRMLVLAQGFPSEEALSRNLFCVTTTALPLIAMRSHFSVARVLYSGSAILRGCPRGRRFLKGATPQKMELCRFRRATRLRPDRGDALCPRGIWVGSRTLAVHKQNE